MAEDKIYDILLIIKEEIGELKSSSKSYISSLQTLQLDYVKHKEDINAHGKESESKVKAAYLGYITIIFGMLELVSHWITKKVGG